MPPVFLSPNTTVLDCGAGCTGLGVFHREGPKLRCVHSAAESLPIGPVNEELWLKHTAAAFLTLNASRPWSGPVVLVLPAHLTLTKQIKIPRADATKRSQVIR